MSMFLVPRFKTEKPFEPEVASASDVRLASIAFGFTLGWGMFTSWHAFKQSRRLTTYVVLIWTEIVVCLIFAIICYLYLVKVIAPSFAFYFCILTTWAIQVQVLLQIIVNRINILLASPVRRAALKFGVAGFILLINISVYCIWLPARLQISARYIAINAVWDRCEKVVYLVVDAALNYLFIRMVSTRLVDLGLTKYSSLLLYNKRIIIASLAMDVLIIGMMSLPNSFVYMQFHSVAYLVKCEIEMAMSGIMIKVAAASTGIEDINQTDAHGGGGGDAKFEQRRTGPVRVKIVQTIEEEIDPGYPATLREGRGANRYDEDEDEVDEKDRKFGDEEVYPSALSKYATFFPPDRDDAASPTSPPTAVRPPGNRGPAPNPFVSTDTLEMHQRTTSLSSTRRNITTADSDDDL